MFESIDRNNVVYLNLYGHQRGDDIVWHIRTYEKNIDETIYNLNFGGSKRRSERE